MTGSGAGRGPTALLFPRGRAAKRVLLALSLLPWAGFLLVTFLYDRVGDGPVLEALMALPYAWVAVMYLTSLYYVARVLFAGREEHGVAGKVFWPILLVLAPYLSQVPYWLLHVRGYRGPPPGR